MQKILKEKNSSFFLKWFFFFGLVRANAASKFADDPEFTMIGCLEPTKFENISF